MSLSTPPSIGSTISLPSTDSRWWHSPIGAAAVLVLLALAVRLAFFIGYQGSDDRNYLAYAHYLASGQDLQDLDIRNQWVGRIGFWIPVAASMKILGSSQVGYMLYPLLCSLAGILVAFALGVQTVGRRAALLAAALLTILPLDVLYATKAYPDVPIGVLMVAAYWLALKSRTSPRAVWFGFGAGLLMGLAYLNKETAIFAFLPLGLVLRFWSREHWHTIAAIAVAFTLVVVAEAGFWSAVKGDPLYRFHSTGGALARQEERSGPRDALPSGWLPGPRPRDSYRSTNSLADAALMLGTNEELGLLYWLVVPMLAWSVATRDRSTRELRLWLLPLLLVILFLPLSEWRVTLPRDPRYLTCLTIPALLILADYLLRMKRIVRLGTLGAIVFTSIVGLLVGRESSRMELEQILQQKQDATDQRLWVTPQFAADLLALGGMDSAPPLGVHLLEQGRTANSFEAAMLIRPEIPVAASAAEITSGIIVLRDRPRQVIPPGWVLLERIEPRPSWHIRQVQRVLRGRGLDQFARRLAPSGGETASLYVRAATGESH